MYSEQVYKTYLGLAGGSLVPLHGLEERLVQVGGHHDGLLGAVAHEPVALQLLRHARPPHHRREQRGVRGQRARQLGLAARQRVEQLRLAAVLGVRDQRQEGEPGVSAVWLA